MWTGKTVHTLPDIAETCANAVNASQPPHLWRLRAIVEAYFSSERHQCHVKAAAMEHQGGTGAALELHLRRQMSF